MDLEYEKEIITQQQLQQGNLSPQLEYLSYAQKSYNDESIGETDAEIAELCDQLSQIKDHNFIPKLRKLSIHIKNGYTQSIITHTSFLKKLIVEIINYHSNVEMEKVKDKQLINLMFLLSIIAQLMQSHPKFPLPINQRFVQVLLSINNEIIEVSSERRNILAILGVIYENISRQYKKMGYNKLEQFKRCLLQNYYLIEQPFTFKAFNKALINLKKNNIVISEKDFYKYKIVEVLRKFVPHKQVTDAIGKIVQFMKQPSKTSKPY